MKKITLFSLMFLVFFACRKDFDQQVVTVDSHIPDTINLDDPNIDPIPVIASLAGIVYDEDKQPIADALVTLNDQNTITDEQGSFVFKQIQMDAAGTFVLVKKDGYFNGSNRFFPKNNSQNYSTIKLLTKTHIGSFNSNSGGEVNSLEGIKIVFPANGIVDSEGQIYDGNVNVAAREIDPTANDLAEIMPGDLQGFNRFNEEVALASFGMMAVELTDDFGQELNMGNNQKAELTFPVPFELKDDAPDEIPLWYFNESYGLWQEEGTASLIGENYVGEVSHFSFWNCDAPFPLVYISGTLKDENGSILANTWVCIHFAGQYIGGRCAQTDNNGYFAGKIPANEALTLYTKYGDCYHNIAIDFGPFDVDTDLGDFIVDSPDLVEIKGSVLNCSGGPINNGWVAIKPTYNYSYYYFEGNNEFSLSILNCDDATEIQVQAVDFESGQESDEMIFPLEVPLTDLGEITACGSVLNEYLSFTVNSETRIFPQASVGQDSSGIFIMYANEFGSLDYFNIGFSADAPGIYDGSAIEFFNIQVDFPSQGPLSLWCQELECGLTEIIFTEFGAVGEKVIGTFSGTGDFVDQQQQTITLPYSGEFEIVRDF